MPRLHKSPLIARWQADRGAVGQCVQKVAEAEVLVWGGVKNVLVSNEIVSPAKLARLAGLARTATISVSVDNPAAVELLSQAAVAAGSEIAVLVEIEVGGGRCGVAPGAEAVRLASLVDRSPNLRFGGLHAYHGRAQHLRSPSEREDAIRGASAKAALTVDALRAAGLACPIVSGAGTGTFELEAASGVFTEIQAGSYLFMDADYSRNSEPPSFGQSLFVLSTVMSTPRPGVAVIDCGHKGIAIDSGLPLVADRPGLLYVGASDEHGNLQVSGPEPVLGEKVRLIPGHCDPTVDRHDWYVGVRNGRVELVWPVAARGAMT